MLPSFDKRARLGWISLNGHGNGTRDFLSYWYPFPKSWNMWAW